MVQASFVCRCASDAEEQSALYNMACAYAALGKRDSALTCLEARAASWCYLLGSGTHASKCLLLQTVTQQQQAKYAQHAGTVSGSDAVLKQLQHCLQAGPF